MWQYSIIAIVLNTSIVAPDGRIGLILPMVMVMVMVMVNKMGVNEYEYITS